MDLKSYNKALKITSRFILKNSGTYNDIYEVLHGASEIYYTKNREGKIKPGANEVTLICRIAERMWKDELKKRRKKPVLIPISNDLVDTDASELDMKKRKEAFLDKLEQQIHSMKEPCRTIILRIMAGESYESLVEDMGSFDLVNMRKNHYRCKEKLKNMIKAINELKEMSYDG